MLTKLQGKLQTKSNRLADASPVLLEVNNFLYNGCSRSSISGLLVAFVLVYTLRDFVSIENLISWCAIFLSAYAIRYVLLSRLRRLHFKNTAFSVRLNLNIFRILTAMCGLAWGSAGIFLFPHNTENQAVLAIVLAGVAGGAVASYAIDKVTALAFTAGIVLLTIPNFMLNESRLSNALLTCIALYIITVIMAEFTSGKSVRENILLKHDERKSKEEINLLAQRQQLHIEQTPLAVIEWDSALNITFWNAAASHMFGFSSDQALGKSAQILFTEADIDEFQANIQQLIAGSGGKNLQTRNVTQDKKIIQCEWFNTVLKDNAGNLTGITSLVQDETDYFSAREEIERLAYYDALTGLPNRRLLLDRVTLALAKSSRKKFYGCLMFIDLDNFKALNDTYGHASGDLLLITAAKRLKNVLRKSDTVSRIGGDEFVLLIEDIAATEEQALEKSSMIAEKVVNEISHPFLLEEITYSSSPSIGVCLFSDEEFTTDELLHRADAAMYQAKQSGKGKYYHYNEEIQKNVNNKAELKRCLQKAIDESLFYLNFQPQFNVSRKITGAEALLRLTINGKNISPAEFIPVAEETKLIIPIGTWVLEQACKQLYQWQQAEFTRELRLPVNVSALQFSQNNFVQEVERIVSASQCNPAKLTLELTESTVIQNFDDVISKMHRLNSYGISLSMDDFGTGYSSLSVLNKLPLHEVKIDRSFVYDLAVNPDSAVIVQSIIAMTLSLGLNIIAEGVETEEQVSLLLKGGCQNFQGFLFSRPVNLEQLEDTLLTQNETRQPGQISAPTSSYLF